jgi:hypothetical protein
MGPKMSPVMRVSRCLFPKGPAIRVLKCLFSQGPVIVTDKTDIVGTFAHPLYKYMTTNMPNPNDVLSRPA